MRLRSLPRDRNRSVGRGRKCMITVGASGSEPPGGDDLDRDLATVGGGVGDLVTDLVAEDGGAQRALLAVDVEIGVAGDLAAAEQEGLLLAGQLNGHHQS